MGRELILIDTRRALLCPTFYILDVDLLDFICAFLALGKSGQFHYFTVPNQGWKVLTSFDSFPMSFCLLGIHSMDYSIIICSNVKKEQLHVQVTLHTVSSPPLLLSFPFFFSPCLSP